MCPKNKSLDLDILWLHGTLCRWRLGSAVKSLSFWPRSQSLQAFPQEVTSSLCHTDTNRVLVWIISLAMGRGTKASPPSHSFPFCPSCFLIIYPGGTHPSTGCTTKCSSPDVIFAWEVQVRTNVQAELQLSFALGAPETTVVVRNARAAIFSWHQSYKCQSAPAVLPTFHPVWCTNESEEPTVCDWAERWQFHILAR